MQKLLLASVALLLRSDDDVIMLSVAKAGDGKLRVTISPTQENRFASFAMTGTPEKIEEVDLTPLIEADKSLLEGKDPATAVAEAAERTKKPKEEKKDKEEKKEPESKPVRTRKTYPSPGTGTGEKKEKEEPTTHPVSMANVPGNTPEADEESEEEKEARAAEEKRRLEEEAAAEAQRKRLEEEERLKAEAELKKLQDEEEAEAKAAEERKQKREAALAALRAKAGKGAGAITQPELPKAAVFTAEHPEGQPVQE